MNKSTINLRELLLCIMIQSATLLSSVLKLVIITESYSEPWLLYHSRCISTQHTAEQDPNTSGKFWKERVTSTLINPKLHKNCAYFFRYVLPNKISEC